jgi:DNA-binding Lrp family transcriptional regulator
MAPKSSNSDNKSITTLHAIKFERLDELDNKLLELMLAGFSNNEMAAKTAKPLSTIQRRSRELVESGIISRKFELNHAILDYRVFHLHVYVNGADAGEIAKRVRDADGAQSVSVHIGNSDIVAKYVCKSSHDLMEIIGDVKKIDGVIRVEWSEEIYSLPPPPSSSIM